MTRPCHSGDEPPRLLLADPLSATLGELLHAAAKANPHGPALLGAERSMSWSELDLEVNRLAHLLQRVGVAAGDPIGIICNKRPEVVIAFLACARLGAVLTPVNFKLHRDRILDQFQTIRIRCVLVEREFDDLLQHLAGPLCDRRKVIYLDDPPAEGATQYREIEDCPSTPPEFRATPDTVCYYNYTSGTTGRPKGAITTHRNILVNALSGVEGFGFSTDDVFMGMFSVFSHPHELFHRSLLVGGAFVIVDTLSPRIVCQTIERFRVTWMMAVPSFYEMMIDRGDADKFDMRSLRVLEAGGAYVSAETLQRMEKHFGAWFMPVWGSTETTGVALAMPPGKPRLPGATGRPAPHYEVRVVNDEGQEVAPGEVGQMLMQSAAVALGYENRHEETASHFQEGWYLTGDLVRRDEQGFIHFVGRQSEMLKVGGIRVYPLELEQIIGNHPEVEEVVVVGHHERLRGEVPRAVVATVPGSTLDVKALKNWCRDHLATYQVPRVVEFWKEIPRLPNGKVDKARVREVLADPRRDERDA